jgi:hypothetical protein
MRIRTDAEIKAYTDGYNDAFNQFKECLKGRKSVADAVRKMQVFADAVNNVVATNGEIEDGDVNAD